MEEGENWIKMLRRVMFLRLNMNSEPAWNSALVETVHVLRLGNLHAHTTSDRVEVETYSLLFESKGLMRLTNDWINVLVDSLV